MASFNFGNIAQELNDVQEDGVEFQDKQLSWDTADDVKDVVSAIENKKVLHYLKLDGNTLGVDAAAAIGKALERHPEFRKALWKNMFTRRLKTEIPQALKHLSNGMIVAKAQLAVLDLSDNALGPNGMVGLEDLLRSPVCYSLQELHLNNCGLGVYGGQMLSKALLDCHRSSTAAGTPLKLKVFLTGRNRLENEGAKAIARLFAALKTLEEIAMPQNSIYHAGIAALSEGIKQNPNLRVLNLNDNILTPKGAAALADAFAFTPNLREINFGDCLIKTNGAYQFAEALDRDHQQLEFIDLGFNEIGADAALVLITALQNKPNLQKLYLDGNNFGTEGRQSILEAMKNTANPRALDTLEEDNSDAEEDDDDDDEEEEDDEDDNDEAGSGNEDEIYGHDHANDTTEEADAYDECEGDEAEESAYMTTTGFTTKMLNANETLSSCKNVTFSNDVKANSIEIFCLSVTPCSLQMFESIESTNKLQAFRDVINRFSDNTYLLILIFTALKCAHLSKSSKEALEIAIALFKQSFDYAVETKQERRLVNFYLKQLGLLNSEEKFKTQFDFENCYYALNEILSKEKLASEYMNNTLNFFLNSAKK